MLEQILAALAGDAALSSDQLAARLGASPELLAEMLADLGRRGYVERHGLACEPGECQRCVSRSGCRTRAELWGWSLTDRGRRVAAAARSG